MGGLVTSLIDNQPLESGCLGRVGVSHQMVCARRQGVSQDFIGFTYEERSLAFASSYSTVELSNRPPQAKTDGEHLAIVV